LLRWFSEHSQPELAHSTNNHSKASNPNYPLFFGNGGSYILASGRCEIVRALAEGYLRQEPPNLGGWAEFIKSQLGIEPHPAVWVDIVAGMGALLGGDRADATELLDQVIQNCPGVLEHGWALINIAHYIGWLEPQETVEKWLNMLQANNSNLTQQAYGELLVIKYFQYQDEWSVQRIDAQLENQANESATCGLAHAASHFWHQQRCRVISAKILYHLASSSSSSVQQAVASIFRLIRCQEKPFKPDPGMRKVITAVCENPGVLLKAAEDVVEIIEMDQLVETHSDIVVKVCRSLIDAWAELASTSYATARVAERIIPISIQLHRLRLPQCREAGLRIFEDLMSLNPQEIKAALEVLDRKPNRSGYFLTRNRKIRSRQQ
jgi:hypothetical protein